MDVLFKLTDKDIGMPEKEVKEYKIRIAANRMKFISLRDRKVLEYYIAKYKEG